MYLKVPIYRCFEQTTKKKKGCCLDKNQTPLVFFYKKSPKAPEIGIERTFLYVWKYKNKTRELKKLECKKNRLVIELTKNLDARIRRNAFEKQRFCSYFCELCFLQFFEASELGNVPIDFLTTLSLNKRLLTDGYQQPISLLFRPKNSETKNFRRQSSLTFESLTFSLFSNKLYCFYEQTISGFERNPSGSRIKLKSDVQCPSSNEVSKNKVFFCQESLVYFYFFEIQTKFYKLRIHSKLQSSFLSFAKRFLIPRVFRTVLLQKFVLLLFFLIFKEVLCQTSLPKKQIKVSLEKSMCSNLISIQNRVWFYLLKTRFRSFCLKSLNNFLCFSRTNTNLYSFTYRKVSNFFCRPNYIKSDERRLFRPFLNTKRNPTGHFSKIFECFVLLQSTFEISPRTLKQRFQNSSTTRQSLKNLNQKQLNIQQLNEDPYFCYFAEKVLTFNLKSFLNDNNLKTNKGLGSSRTKENSRVSFSDFYLPSVELIRVSLFCFSVYFFMMLSIMNIRQTIKTFLFFNRVNLFVSTKSSFIWAQRKKRQRQSFSDLRSLVSPVKFDTDYFQKHIFLLKRHVVRNRFLFLKVFRLETFFFCFFDASCSTLNSTKILESWRNTNFNGLKSRLVSIEEVLKQSFSSFVELVIFREILRQFSYATSNCRNTEDTFVHQSFHYLQKKHFKFIEQNQKFSRSFFLEKLKIYREELKRVFKLCASQKQELLLKKLNRKIVSWIYRNQSQLRHEDLTYLDVKTKSLSWRWCCRRHNNKSKKWIQFKYYRKFQQTRWIFGKIQVFHSNPLRQSSGPTQNRAVFFSIRKTGFYYRPSHRQVFLIFHKSLSSVF